MRYIHSFIKALVGGVKRFFRYAFLAVNEFLDDNGAHLSASVAYYLLFSVLPVLLAIASIVGFVYGTTGITTDVADYLRSLLPSYYAEAVIGVLDEVQLDRSIMGTVGLIGMIWAGTSVFNVIRKTLNIIWGITIPRPYFRERFIEIII